MALTMRRSASLVSLHPLPSSSCLSVVQEKRVLTLVVPAYDYVELTREVLNEVEVDYEGSNRYSGEAQSYDPREKNKSIPLMDATMFGLGHGQSSHQ